MGHIVRTDQITDVRERWREIAVEVDRVLAGAEETSRAREEAVRQAEEWRAAIDEAERRAEAAERERDRLEGRLAELEEVVQFIRYSDEGGLSRLSGAVRAMVEAAVAEARERAGRPALPPSAGD